MHAIFMIRSTNIRRSILWYTPNSQNGRTRRNILNVFIFYIYSEYDYSQEYWKMLLVYIVYIFRIWLFISERFEHQVQWCAANSTSNSTSGCLARADLFDSCYCLIYIHILEMQLYGNCKFCKARRVVTRSLDESRKPTSKKHKTTMICCY